ncbi:LysM peptidoglycan-binding domain-containing protein [Marimonas lutisalis]|uniref:LysM peptidoglycan-binding domain-containing protein n=1 Tax=Marimonas lutisalis TaxID=2545756 RepID=UPI0013758839|nr:LysM peptidoglycan-binding domain-containing protein [Marimonas lutisalis]
MIRILIIAAAFLSVTVGLLLLQPGSEPARDTLATSPAPRTPAPDAQVSRAETDLSHIVTRQADAAAPANPADRLGAAVALATAPAAAPAGDSASPDALRNLTTGVLADLGAPSATNDADALRSMTSGVLASLNAATTTRSTDGPAPLETIIVQALREGQSDAYLDALLNEAAATGAIQVPSALVTSEGRVDTVTLLANLVQKSSGQSGLDTSALAAAAGRPQPRPAALAYDQVYVVQPGDSLAAISYRFYGETLRYREIFTANQDKLSSPDKIRIGQRLTIPAL